MYLLQDMAQKIIDANLAQELGKDIFADYRPEDPDSIIVVSEYNGSGVALGADNFSNRSVQILVRDMSTTKARQRTWEIFKLFNNAETRKIVLGNRVTLMYPRQTPFKMSIDSRRRVMWVFNLGVSTEFDL